MLKNTGVMCMVKVPDPNRAECFRLVDMGNYYANERNEKFLVTSFDLAKEYGHLVKEKIYTPKLV